MRNRGFTIIELVIAISIIGILLVLGVANLNGSQANARDAERKADAETLVLHLDAYYDSGADNSTSTGKYPSTAFITTTTNIKKYLRDIDTKSLTPPGITNPLLSFKGAINASAQTPTKDEYIYQPLKSDGSICNLETQECRKFIIYYRTEVDNTVHTVTGKNQ